MPSTPAPAPEVPPPSLTCSRKPKAPPAAPPSSARLASSPACPCAACCWCSRQSSAPQDRCSTEEKPSEGGGWDPGGPAKGIRGGIRGMMGLMNEEEG